MEVNSNTLLMEQLGLTYLQWDPQFIQDSTFMLHKQQLKELRKSNSLILEVLQVQNAKLQNLNSEEE